MKCACPHFYGHFIAALLRHRRDISLSVRSRIRKGHKWPAGHLTDAQITAPTIKRLSAWIGTDTSRKV